MYCLYKIIRRVRIEGFNLIILWYSHLHSGWWLNPLACWAFSVCLHDLLVTPWVVCRILGY